MPSTLDPQSVAGQALRSHWPHFGALGRGSIIIEQDVQTDSFSSQLGPLDKGLWFKHI
jgi:hypothetical protein